MDVDLLFEMAAMDHVSAVLTDIQQARAVARLIAVEGAVPAPLHVLTRNTLVGDVLRDAPHRVALSRLQQMSSDTETLTAMEAASITMRDVADRLKSSFTPLKGRNDVTVSGGGHQPPPTIPPRIGTLMPEPRKGGNLLTHDAPREAVKVKASRETVARITASGKALKVTALSPPSAQAVVKSGNLGKYGRGVAILIAVALATRVGFYLNKSTVAGLDAMMAVPLPSDEQGYDTYVSKLINIMNSKTNFHVSLEGADQSIKEETVTLSLNKLNELKDVHEDALDRFQSVPDRLQTVAAHAKTMNSPWAIKGALVLHQLVTLVVRKASSGKGLVGKLARRIDALYDKK